MQLPGCQEHWKGVYLHNSSRSSARTLELTDLKAQQLHTYLRWTSIKLDQFDYVSTRAGNPELSVAGASVNSDLVLFYIRQLP